MSVLKALTKDIVERNVSAENAALVDKWEQTGLLEGLDDTTSQNEQGSFFVRLPQWPLVTWKVLLPLRSQL